MGAKKFSKGEAIRFGWKTATGNIGFFIGLFLLVLVIYSIPYFLIAFMGEGHSFLTSILTFASYILQMIVGMGLTKISLKFCDNAKAQFSDLFSCPHLFLNYFFGSIVYATVVTIGIFLLIIPGIIWAIKYQFFVYEIVDKGAKAIDSLQKSGQMTYGAKWDLFLLGFLLAGINLLGVLALGVGLFVTLPTTMVTMAFVYRKLS